MKQIILSFALIIGFGSSIQAQDSKYGEDSVTCREQLLIYYELARNKNYKDAWEGWDYVYNNCPQASKNTFIYGPSIVKAKIKEAATDEEKQKLKSLLLEVYDNRLVYYPGKEGYVLGRKALEVLEYYPDSTQMAYNLFLRAMEVDGPKQSAAFYNGFFVSAARLFNDDLFNKEQIFESYNIVTEGIEFNNNELNVSIAKLEAKQESASLSSKEEKKLAKDQRELERYTDVESNIEKILGPIATCKNLEVLYNDSTFALHTEDDVWLRRANKMLSQLRTKEDGETGDCTDNPIFFKVAEALYRLSPSAASARSMGTMAYKDGNFVKASEYFKEAADQEADPIKRAEDYLKIGVSFQKRGNLSLAKTALLQAAKSRKNWGDPYIVLATVYAQAAGDCGSNAFEKNAVYWAAINKANYAASIDPSVSSKAAKLINAYKQGIPDKGVSFQLGHKQGESYTIGCWINETVVADWTL